MLQILYWIKTISWNYQPSLVNTPFIQGGSLDVSYNFKNDSLLHYQKLYYDKIEQGNRYMEELESIEKNYLTRKYGQIYNYLMNQKVNISIK